MPSDKPDTTADTEAPIDRGESVNAMEPLRLSVASRHFEPLSDLAVDLAARAEGFRRSLPEGIRAALADLVRSMNCYYSNLIEGHDTHPIEIERALKDEYSPDARQRNLQMEAKAHIEVQRWLDQGGLRGRSATVEGLQAIHRRFCDHLPDALLWVTDPKTKERIRVVPGELRERDVQVGHHVAISPGAVPRFLKRFESVYSGLGRTQQIISVAAAHHRLLWIHPFLDGNGRVARLMSHSLLLEALDTGGIWSVARGLARNEADYKAHLAACDQPRKGDLDGRGSLTEQGLAEFTRFFLEICLDQVRFMESLVQPQYLRKRILGWVDEAVAADELPKKSGSIMEAVLYRGELPRSDLAAVVGTSDRQARRVASALIQEGVLTSQSTRAPLRLAFPAKLAGRWMPGLFPER